MKLVFLVLISLILSIGITPALSFDFIPKADALKSKGNSLIEIGSKKVCGDKLCSKMDSKHSMKPDTKMHSGSMDMHAMMYRMDKMHEKHQQHMMQSWNSMTSDEQSQMFHKMQKMIEKMESMDMDEHMKIVSNMGEKDHDKKMHKDYDDKHETVKYPAMKHPEKMRTAASLPETSMGPQIDYSKGYLAEEIKDGLYWVTDGAYQVMFLTTGEGVIVVDAPPSIGHNYLKAIREVTDEPIIYVIYSHTHNDHVGVMSMFPDDVVYIVHQEIADTPSKKK